MDEDELMHRVEAIDYLQTRCLKVGIECISATTFFTDKKASIMLAF